MLTTILRYAVPAVFILLLGGLFFWQLQKNTEMNHQLQTTSSELQAAKLEIGKAHTTIESQAKLHKEALSALDSQLQDEVKKRKALITLYAELQAKYDAVVEHEETLTTIVEELSKAKTIADLPEGELFYKRTDGTLSEVKSIGWNWEDFRLTLAGETTTDGLDSKSIIKIKHNVSYKLHMKIKAQFIEAKLPNGAATHYAKVFELDAQNKTIGELELTSFEVVKAEALASRMQWWNPKVDLGIGAGMNNKLGFAWMGEVGTSLSSYGRTKNDNSWRFFRFGIGITGEKDLSLTFSPAQWNLGSSGTIPLISNTWIYPFVGTTPINPSVNGGLGISVVF